MAQSMIFTRMNTKGALASIHPFVKLMALIITSILLSSGPALTVYVLFLAIILTAMIERIPLLRLMRDCIFILFLALFIMLSEYLETRDTASTILATIRFLSIFLSSILFTALTTPDETARALGSALSHIFGQFGWQVASAIELTLAMLPLIFNCAGTLFDARKSRGGRFLRHPIKTISEYTITLMLSLLKTADEYTEALAARFYDSSKARSPIPYHGKDLLFVASLITIIGGSVWISRRYGL